MMPCRSARPRSALVHLPIPLLCLGIAATLASACGGSDSNNGSPPSAGGAAGSADASTETSVGGGAGKAGASGAAGSGGTAGAAGTGGAAGTAGTAGAAGDAGPAGSAGQPDGGTPDAPVDAFACTTDADCVGNAAGPYCKVASGECVACKESDPSTCEPGKWCDPATSTCVAGCDDANDCAVDTTCDPATHTCVGCIDDTQCPLGQTCQGNACAAGCTQQHGCPIDQACCSGACVLTDSDPANCGSCGFACDLPNATSSCVGGKCSLEACLQGWENCDQKAANGCEANTCPCAPNATEPCYTGPAGTQDVGPCHGGTRTCNDSGSAWGPCEGEVVPTQESCFTPIDDDCNGAVNEGGTGCVCTPKSTGACYTGDPSTRGVGACSDGSRTCSDDGTAWGACEGETLPTAETCATSVDDDCDGQVNEAGGVGCLCTPGSSVSCYGGPAGTQGVGVCKAGTQTCNSMGTGWEPCTGDVVPSADVCGDSLDNDCNGSIDDGYSTGAAGCVCLPGAKLDCYSGGPGTLGVGVCVGGLATCNAGGTGVGQCVGEVTPSIDVCTDSLDNDCNGIANDGVGNGGAECTCVPGAQVDCYEGPAGTLGKGVCKSGKQTCSDDGKNWGPCYGQIIPDFDICTNAFDDDCNGVINDGFDEGASGCVCIPGASASCYSGPSGTQGVGACKAGSHTCTALGNSWGDCVGEVTPNEEICANGIDDDCNGTADVVPDVDGDGWTRCAGDCCEDTTQCGSPTLVNPGAFEVQGDGVDNNCNAQVDENPYTTCSTGTNFTTSVNATKALALLNAMELCQVSQNGSWGIVPGSYSLTRADGSSTPDYRQVGITTQFGTHSSNVPKAGSNMTMLSAGRARDANDPDATADLTYTYATGAPPADFVAPHGGALPQTSPSCTNGSGANDSVRLRVQLKVPTNANSLSFQFRFFSQEYWYWTCTSYNDFFIAMLDSQWTPGPGQTAIPADKNISFDSNGSYISVNSTSFFTTCCQPKTGYTCPDGKVALAGTGYYDYASGTTGAGATRWLTTTSPVKPGETITLRFIIWDTSDQAWDSQVLLDNFRWSATPSNGPITQ